MELLIDQRMKPQQRSVRRGAPPAVPAPLADYLPVLLWDVSPGTIDPQVMARTIVQRMIEHGTSGDWEAMLAYYGRERVRETAKASPYLSDAAIQLVECGVEPGKRVASVLPAQTVRPSDLQLLNATP